MMEINTTNSGPHGVKWGLIIGMIYAILVYLRYSVGANSAIFFGMFTIVSYIVILVLLFFMGFQLRKQNGGYIEMKEVFKTMFIAVLIFELFFAAVTFIYLKWVDPAFFDKLKITTEELLIAGNKTQREVDEVMDEMDVLAQQSSHLGMFDFLKSYLYYVGISGLFALIFSFILKRKPANNDYNNYPQSS